MRLSIYFFPPLGSQGKRTTLSAVEYTARQKQNVIFLCKFAKKWEAEVACGACHAEQCKVREMPSRFTSYLNYKL